MCILAYSFIFLQKYLRNISLHHIVVYLSICILGFEDMYFDICIPEYISECLCPALRLAYVSPSIPTCNSHYSCSFLAHMHHSAVRKNNAPAAPDCTLSASR